MPYTQLIKDLELLKKDIINKSIQDKEKAQVKATIDANLEKIQDNPEIKEYGEFFDIIANEFKKGIDSIDNEINLEPLLDKIQNLSAPTGVYKDFFEKERKKILEMPLNQDSLEHFILLLKTLELELDTSSKNKIVSIFENNHHKNPQRFMLLQNPHLSKRERERFIHDWHQSLDNSSKIPVFNKTLHRVLAYTTTTPSLKQLTQELNLLQEPQREEHSLSRSAFEAFNHLLWTPEPKTRPELTQGIKRRWDIFRAEKVFSQYLTPNTSLPKLISSQLQEKGYIDYFKNISLKDIEKILTYIPDFQEMQRLFQEQYTIQEKYNQQLQDLIAKYQDHRLFSGDLSMAQKNLEYPGLFIKEREKLEKTYHQKFAPYQKKMQTLFYKSLTVLHHFSSMDNIEPKNIEKTLQNLSEKIKEKQQQIPEIKGIISDSSRRISASQKKISRFQKSHQHEHIIKIKNRISNEQQELLFRKKRLEEYERYLDPFGFKNLDYPDSGQKPLQEFLATFPYHRETTSLTDYLEQHLKKSPKEFDEILEKMSPRRIFTLAHGATTALDSLLQPRILRSGSIVFTNKDSKKLAFTFKIIRKSKEILEKQLMKDPLFIEMQNNINKLKEFSNRDPGHKAMREKIEHAKSLLRQSPRFPENFFSTYEKLSQNVDRIVMQLSFGSGVAAAMSFKRLPRKRQEEFIDRFHSASTTTRDDIEKEFKREFDRIEKKHQKELHFLQQQAQQLENEPHESDNKRKKELREKIENRKKTHKQAIQQLKNKYQKNIIKLQKNYKDIEKELHQDLNRIRTERAIDELNHLFTDKEVLKEKLQDKSNKEYTELYILLQQHTIVIHELMDMIERVQLTIDYYQKSNIEKPLDLKQLRKKQTALKKELVLIKGVYQDTITHIETSLLTAHDVQSLGASLQQNASYLLRRAAPLLSWSATGFAAQLTTSSVARLLPTIIATPAAYLGTTLAVGGVATGILHTYLQNSDYYQFYDAQIVKDLSSRDMETILSYRDAITKNIGSMSMVSNDFLKIQDELKKEIKDAFDKKAWKSTLRQFLINTSLKKALHRKKSKIIKYSIIGAISIGVIVAGSIFSFGIPIIAGIGVAVGIGITIPTIATAAASIALGWIVTGSWLVKFRNIYNRLTNSDFSQKKDQAITFIKNYHVSPLLTSDISLLQFLGKIQNRTEKRLKDLTRQLEQLDIPSIDKNMTIAEKEESTHTFEKSIQDRLTEFFLITQSYEEIETLVNTINELNSEKKPTEHHKDTLLTKIKRYIYKDYVSQEQNLIKAFTLEGRRVTQKNAVKKNFVPLPSMAVKGSHTAHIKIAQKQNKNYLTSFQKYRRADKEAIESLNDLKELSEAFRQTCRNKTS